ncbi:hypothetical protein LSAT2_017026 [Lamellibrachia satsuma]|nr:hypothetical protein LSAT2_017026 [Lamellibrachia satsuma]
MVDSVFKTQTLCMNNSRLNKQLNLLPADMNLLPVDMNLLPADMNLLPADMNSLDGCMENQKDVEEVSSTKEQRKFALPPQTTHRNVVVYVALIAATAGAQYSEGYVTVIQNASSGICPPTRVTVYGNGTSGGRVKCMLVDWTPHADAPINCLTRIPLNNAAHRQKEVTLYTEFFDTELHMMVLIINGRRFHGNGFRGDPSAMKVGKTYEFITRNTTFDLYFMGNRHSFPRSRGFSLRFMIRDVSTPRAVHLTMSPAVLGQPTLMTCSWLDALEPVSEVKYITSGRRELLYRYYRNTVVTEAGGILTGSTVRLEPNRLLIYINATKRHHLMSYRCLVWDKNYIAFSSAAVSLREASKCPD